MYDPMTGFELLWWHWVLLGITVLIVDVVLIGNSGILLWFGAGAFAVGAWVFLGPGSPLWLQFVLWLGFSLTFLVLWIKLFKPRIDRRNVASVSEEMIGVVGVVARVGEFEDGIRRGTVRFQKPFAGRDTWKFQSDASLSPGDRVAVTILTEDGVLAVNKELGGSSNE